MNTLTKEWLMKTIAELEEERDATPGAVNEDADKALAAMKLAMASLEAEAVAFRSKLKPPSAIGSENWGYTDHRLPDAFELESCVIERLYTAPPAPVSVPEMKPVDLDEGFDEWYSEGESGADSVAPEWFSEAMKPVFLGTWRACRAAMLQGADGNSPAHSGCRPAQNCISPAQCGNSPAIPDGWVMVPEEPTHEMLEAGDEQFGTYDVYRRMIAASPQQK
ncbi:MULTISPECIES: hypothetical protein [Enterobacter]|uniref:hypothetical protein n=1 Tax=Enterobacter TaxID=547 RepID=UPI000BD8CCC6|nr:MULTISPECIES: hypothetical protein [Enterobacter]PAC69523.1 hypothetical protein CGS27_15875 [Enterobacter cloacae]MCM7702125.1 hypothetical protein [Enterobacter hormaechei]MCM7707177.1 hypothetical protein [Enterobacter hormaechei]MCM7711616.1 hypothetical protein [Enterobacter hormaechei]MCM7715609.1 hypothetical protein [Enterobacter hormaechei]